MALKKRTSDKGDVIVAPSAAPIARYGILKGLPDIDSLSNMAILCLNITHAVLSTKRTCFPVNRGFLSIFSRSFQAGVLCWLLEIFFLKLTEH